MKMFFFSPNFLFRGERKEDKPPMRDKYTGVRIWQQAKYIFRGGKGKNTGLQVNEKM